MHIPAIPGRHSLYRWFAVLLGVAAIPLLVTSVPPLVDYPNHLARIHLLAHLPSLPALQPFYQIAWAPLPNLAFDLLGTALAWMLPTPLAGTVALLITMALMASGVLAVRAALRPLPRQDGPPNLFCLTAFLFLFSQPFYYGFIGSMLGVGLMLWAVSLWWRLREGPGPALVAAGVAMGLVLYFAHLFSLAVFGVVTGCMELQRALGRGLRPGALLRSAALLAAPMLIPAWLFLAASGTPLAGPATAWIREWQDVLPILLSPVWSIAPLFDLETMAAVLAVLGFGFATGRLHVAREMRLALAVLAVLSVLMPELLASSYFAHIRLPAIVLLLLCAAGEWRGADWLTKAGAMALLGLFCVRTALLSQEFMERGAFLDRLRLALDAVPAGTRLASTTVRSADDGRNQLGWDHGLCLAVIDRSAYVANVFTVPGQQPLRPGPAAAATVPPGVLSGLRPQAFVPGMFADLDLFVLINPGALTVGLPALLQLVHHDTDFDVYRFARADKIDQ